MPYHDLINALITDGKNQCEFIIEKAKSDAEEIVEKAEETLDLRRKEYIDIKESDVKIKAVAIINRAKIKAKGMIINAKQEIIEGVLQSAGKRFLEIKMSNVYPIVFEKLCKEVLDDIKGETTVLLDTEDTELFKKKFPSLPVKIKSVEGNSKTTGLEVLTVDGAVIIRNTLNSRLEKIKPDLILELNKMLFG